MVALEVTSEDLDHRIGMSGDADRRVCPLARWCLLGRLSVDVEVESVLEIIEATGTHPMSQVRGGPSLQLGFRIIVKHMATKMDRAKIAMVVVVVRDPRTPTAANARSSLGGIGPGLGCASHCQRPSPQSSTEIAL